MSKKNYYAGYLTAKKILLDYHSLLNCSNIMTTDKVINKGEQI